MPKLDMAALLGPKAPAEDASSYSSDLETAMEDLIAAVKAGDPVSAAAAFKAGHEICSGGGEVV